MSPRVGRNAPIPFHLSPSVEPGSPLSPARYASSPDVSIQVTDDSFAQAFTSIKTTDDSMSSRSCLLENLARTDSSISTSQEIHSMDSSLHDASNCSDKQSNELMVTARDQILSSCSRSLSDALATSSETAATDATSTASDMYQTPDSKENIPKAQLPKPRRAHFQSVVHSYSDNYDKYSFRSSNDHPGM